MIGKSLGPYEIVETIGAGGMGEVYLAKDTRLGRQVAVKVLPAEFASDQDRLARFEQEARAAAGLNHPHIAAVHDIGVEDGTHFMVQEYLQGQTLREPLRKGALPLKMALQLATEIGEGLTAAHATGIIHRDLKPENIFITRDNHAKILDFGLAKLTEQSGWIGSDPSESPTMTAAGQVMGTAGYLAPEQAEGSADIDHRADVFAFGCVLYEMLRGEQPFTGRSVAETISRIQHEEPPSLVELDASLPAEAHRIVRKCLAKDPASRYQTPGDLVVDLKSLATEVEAGTAPLAVGSIGQSPMDRRRIKVWQGAAGALALVAIAAWFARPGEPFDPPLPLRSSLVFEPEAGLAIGPGRNVALSPDGTQLAYVTSANYDGGRLWIRDLADGAMRPLAETEGASHPFWKPDGSMLGYFAEQELRVVPATGGSSRVLAPAPQPYGGTWNERDVILYNPNAGPLFQIPAAGDAPAQVTQLTSQGDQHRSPVFLPDGRQFLFWMIDFTQDNNDYVYKGDLETGQFERIGPGGDPFYAEPGFLVFRLGYGVDATASVFAQRFDPDLSALSGQPLPVFSGVEIGDGGNGAMAVTDRTAVFVPMRQEHELPRLTNRNGDLLDSLAHRESSWVQLFSHDGERVAFAGKQLWVHDLERNITEPVPTEATYPLDFAWSPDDTRIVYSATRVRGQLRVVSVAGTEEEKGIFQSEEGSIIAPEWSPDGQTILFIYLPDENRAHRELWAFDVEEETASQVLEGSFDVFEARFAPNGQWFAYMSDEGGTGDIYLRTSPDADDRVRVSVGGGAWPRWSDAGELFYLDGEGRLAAVQVDFEGRPSPSEATILTADPITGNPQRSRIASSGLQPFYDVHPDGQRFLQNDSESNSLGTSRLIILRDWTVRLEEALNR